MNKKCLSVVLSILLFTAYQSHAKFQGPYAGFNFGYGWTNMKNKINDEIVGKKVNGAFEEIQIGYGKSFEDLYLACEGRAGYSFAIQKERFYEDNANYFNMKFHKKWNLGIGFKLGTHFSDTIIGYFSFGFNYDKYGLKMTGRDNNVPTNSNAAYLIWSFVPGVGMDYKLTPQLSFGINYGFNIGFSSRYKNQYISTKVTHNTQPMAHKVYINISYHFK